MKGVNKMKKDRLVIGFVTEEVADSIAEYCWNLEYNDLIILPLEQQGKKMQPFPKWLHEKSRKQMVLNFQKYLELKYPQKSQKDIADTINVIMNLITFM